ncbi:MAG: MarR family transcriptional regulator [Oceanicaulis sp.]|uniref:transcriptional regulator n=1 Tax=Oceanicaulis sp. UBA2681 TaxID=1947007 RepID=UPI000C09DC37|nr:transcriptional regulator [Oceanicaulis sp. UBA2681]MAP48566.1 MarR family transcriptional regulator [Oceanicaulis sp.]HCR65397.1 MarR family transcriptional regulator [Oceanicaulis sp.]|tara:strand:+ start:400 stop:690 length:291 start_codon:yes stop_codon:yes gene_type:complete
MTQPAEAFRHPDRLKLCAFLSPLEEADFQSLKDFVGVSDALMSKHLKALESLGLVKTEKRKHEGRQRTWVSLTREGRAALTDHINHLKSLIDMAGS